MCLRSILAITEKRSRAEGNLIHALGESLPARILLNAIEERGLPSEQSKDADYYVGLSDATETPSIPVSAFPPQDLRLVQPFK